MQQEEDAEKEMQPECQDQTCSSVAELVFICLPGSHSQGSLCKTSGRWVCWTQTEALKAGAWQETGGTSASCWLRSAGPWQRAWPFANRQAPSAARLPGRAGLGRTFSLWWQRKMCGFCTFAHFVVVGAGGGGGRSCISEGNASSSPGDPPALASCREEPPKEQTAIMILITNPRARALYNLIFPQEACNTFAKEPFISK